MSNSGYLIINTHHGGSSRETDERLQELDRLADTAGIKVVGSAGTSRTRIYPDLLVSRDKAAEIIDMSRREDADMIIFEQDLSPSQQRNWERIAGCRVIDRRELILSIFADHARTREAKLQIQLAQYEYTLPRLKRAWTHLSRQQGGDRGTRGEGEKQIELDRRAVQQKIFRIKRDLKKVEQQRSVRRSKRIRNSVPSVSIVGYTNAGKSSLLNSLTRAEILTENKLFATLDATTRACTLPSGRELLLTDTVGFIRNLPPNLEDAFRSTLEESIHSDFLIHLIDGSSPEFLEHITATRSVLERLGVEEKEALMVFNKTDRIPDPFQRSILEARFPDALFVSVRTGEGLETLTESLEKMVSRHTRTCEFTFSLKQYDLISFLHSNSEVVKTEYGPDTITIRAKVTGPVEKRLHAASVRIEPVAV